MKLTKLEHSGVIVEKDGQKIVFDPVEIEHTLPELDDVAAIIITHKHGDHLQPAKIASIREHNPRARVLAVMDAAPMIPESEVAQSGETINMGGFKLQFFGGDHASIVPGEVPCQNIGVLIDDKILNPGDSFDLPEEATKPEILLVPSAAPWCKASEGMIYIQKVRPEVAVPVHNAVLSEFGNNINNNCFRMACEKAGTKLMPLAVGESYEI